MYLCQYGHFAGIWCRECFIRHYDNGHEHIMCMSHVCIFRSLKLLHIKLNTLCNAKTRNRRLRRSMQMPCYS